MKKLLGIITALCILVLVTGFFSPQNVLAADVRTGNNIIISQDQKNLKDLYLFGKTVDLSAPVSNDVVAAGGNLNITGNISNSLTAAGGTITISSKVGNTARIAGGNITIDGPINNDLVVAGGSVTISKHATIGGDLIAAGGQITVEGPVKGKILISGGDITLNSTVGGNVDAGNVGTFTLGPEARINGNLSYTSQQPLTKDPGSIVNGSTSYHHVEKPPQRQPSPQTFLGFSIYGLLVEIVLSILLIYFIRNGLLTILLRMKETPWKSLGIGVLYVIFAPVVSLILLVLLPLGIASFLFYLLVLILSIFIRDIFAGWFIMHWWDKRNKKTYILDWKAGVIGPIVMMLINLIPVLGWLISAIICLIGIGALLINLTTLLPQLQRAPKKR